MIQGMARFYLLSFLLLLALTAVAMISCLSAEAGQVRALPRGLWVVVILLVPLFGPVLYFVFGRPQRGEGGGLPSGLPPAPKTRPLAPDDDPDFLRRLGRARPIGGPITPGPADPRVGPKDHTRRKDDTRANDDGRSNEKPKADDGRPTDAKDDGRTRGDARTTDDQPPSDGGG